MAVADVAPAPVVAAPGAPRILKGDVVVASVDYETVKVGDRGVVVGPCSDPAMSRADLRVLVDFDGKAAYNYRCDTQIQLAPLLDGATFVRDDAVVAISSLDVLEDSMIVLSGNLEPSKNHRAVRK